MRHNIDQFWERVIANSDIESHRYYNLTEIDYVSEKPGLYAWYLDVVKENFDQYYKLYKQKKVSVNVKGSLKEEYGGSMKNTFLKEDFEISPIDYDLCQMANYAFNPPLYIGISKSLRSRLRTHIRELQKIYHGEIKLDEPSEVGKTPFDTIHESKNFARRIGFTIINYKSISLNHLYVKTIEMKNDYSWKDLQKVEKYLNRTFIPTYGRK